MAKVTVKHSRLSRGSSFGMILLGVFTLLFVSGFIGIILIVIGFVMYQIYRRQTVRSQVVTEASSGSSPTVIKEKEIHVVVRIPCKHCGVLNDQLRTKCESCGAPLK
jgi:hypothetical protein